MKQAKNKEKRSLREEWKLFWRAVKIWNELVPGYWLQNTVCIFAEAFAPYFGLFMSAQIVNELAGGCEPHRLLGLAGITVGGGFLISVFIRILQGKNRLKYTHNWEQQLEFLLQVQNSLEYRYIEDPDVALLYSRIIADMNATGAGTNAVFWVIPDLLRNALNIVFSVSLTISMFALTAAGEFGGFLGFINSPASAVLVAAMIVINTFFSIKISMTKTAKVKEAVSELAEENTRHQVYRNLDGYDMTVFGLHGIILEEMRKFNIHPAWVAKQEKVSIKYGTFSILLNAVLNIAIYLFVAIKAFIGAFGIGNFILYHGAIGRFVDAVSGFVRNMGELLYNNRYLVQLYEYLDLPKDMYRGSLAVEKRDDIDYEIEFRDVSFRYPNTDVWALRHVNMKFKIGDKLAIVGENGSGKTTFIKLLCRLYDPTEGKILLNGIDITRYRYDEYIGLFSVVFQDYILFGFPLGENVSAGLTYDDAKVRDCLIRAGMGEKLAALDADKDAKEKDALKRAIGWEYDSEGGNFSGGEIQKIAIARALYKDAPFIILDEPTAALDPIAEAEIYENFNQMVQNKTSVFISHRLSSCKFCDTIAVFDGGQIVQEGPHEILAAAAGGKYSRLWAAQAKYYEK